METLRASHGVEQALRRKHGRAQVRAIRKMIGSRGRVPGFPDADAFSLEAPEPSPIPILVAVPHAGRIYPAGLLRRMRNHGMACGRLEDRHADSVAALAARRTGAALLVAHAPRAMIDLNRATDEMDWSMLRDPPTGIGAHAVGRRARSGLGLVPRRLPGLGELWKDQIDEEDLRARIDNVHRPYHEMLASELGRLRRRWGAALLLDVHSMPPLADTGRQKAPVIVVGDRFGLSCDASLIATVFDYLGDRGVVAAYNRPYAGGYVLDRHGMPRRGVHAIQVEICRSLYLDCRLMELTDRLDETVDMLSGLIRVLAEEIAGLGRGGLPLAAE